MATPPPKNLNNTYHAPTTPHLRPIIICGIIMALAARKAIIEPGSLLYDNVLYKSPNALKAATWIQNGIFYFFYGAHSIESVIFARKLAKHGVSIWSLAWWQWMATCFVGGKFCFEHFERVIGGKRN